MWLPTYVGDSGAVAMLVERLVTNSIVSEFSSQSVFVSDLLQTMCSLSQL